MGTILGSQVSDEEVQLHLPGQQAKWINLKLCAICPDEKCQTINEKVGKDNLLTCIQCSKMFCYMCNKPADESHYDKLICPRHSNPYYDN